jgi:hypothetical protein
MNQQNINIDLSTAPNIECENEECKNTHFVPIFIIKHIHSLVSPTGKDTLVPIQVFKCQKCDHINKLFLEGLTN